MSQTRPAPPAHRAPAARRRPPRADAHLPAVSVLRCSGRLRPRRAPRTAPMPDPAATAPAPFRVLAAVITGRMCTDAIPASAHGPVRRVHPVEPPRASVGGFRVADPRPAPRHGEAGRAVVARCALVRRPGSTDATGSVGGSDHPSGSRVSPWLAITRVPGVPLTGPPALAATGPPGRAPTDRNQASSARVISRSGGRLAGSSCSAACSSARCADRRGR